MRTILRSLHAARYVLTRHWAAGAAALVVAIAVLDFAVSGLAQALIPQLALRWKLSESFLYASLLLLAAGLAIGFLAWHWREFVRGIFTKRLLPDIRQGVGEQLHVVPISNLDTLKVIQEELVAHLFGEATPTDQHVYASFKKNNRRSIALYSDEHHKYIGLASIWPITTHSAERMLRGELIETQLTANDILPAAENSTADYALVQAIGVLDAETNRGKRRGFKLMNSFRRFIRNEFLSVPGRSMTILAVAVSDDGRDLCETLHMERGPMLRYPDGQEYPLYSRAISASDIERWGDLLLELA